jgi:hypothetical protein
LEWRYKVTAGPNPNLRRDALELARLAARLRDLLLDAEHDIRLYPDQHDSASVQRWLAQAAKNIQSYLVDMEKSIHAHDPVALNAAASVLRRGTVQIEDCDTFAWFPAKADLSLTMTRISDLATSIMASINQLEPENLAAARRLLAGGRPA